MKVIKIGGNVIDDPAALEKFQADFASMVGGRRVTDRPMLDVVTMVYAGLINKNMVAALQVLGCNAIGMSGADGAAIVSHRRTGGDVDYGYVGDVDAGFTPVFCAITYDGKNGTLLNTNADTVASQVAVGMARLTPSELIFCFEKDGVLADPADDSSVIRRIDSVSYQELKADGTVSGGMLPKLENAFGALRSGVERVIITSPAYIADHNAPHTEIVL